MTLRSVDYVLLVVYGVLLVLDIGLVLGPRLYGRVKDSAALQTFFIVVASAAIVTVFSLFLDRYFPSTVPKSFPQAEPPTSQPTPPDVEGELKRGCLTGYVSFAVPPRMTEGKTEQVSATVLVPSARQRRSYRAGQTFSMSTVCAVMAAWVNGRGFTVARLGAPNAERAVGLDRPASWVWAVTPEASGSHPLGLSLYTTYGSSLVDIDSRSQQTYVERSWAHRIGAWLKDFGILSGLAVTALASIGLAIRWAARKLVGYWRRRRKRRSVGAVGK